MTSSLNKVLSHVFKNLMKNILFGFLLQLFKFCLTLFDRK